LSQTSITVTDYHIKINQIITSNRHVLMNDTTLI